MHKNEYGSLHIKNLTSHFLRTIMSNLFLLVPLVGCVSISSAQQSSLNLMPVPSNIEVQQGRFVLTSAFDVSVRADKNDAVLYRAVNRTYQTLNRRTSSFFKTQYITPSAETSPAQLTITVRSKTSGEIGVDESYSLKVTEQNIVLDAATTQGALHGLQTILQLVYKEDGKFYFPLVTINDKPRFKWRGLMIDVARHFISLDEMKRNIDAMAVVKMNVLHWHLTDDEGFRVESKQFPLLHERGSNGDYYTQAQLKELVKYAADRGIVIVPEFDMPGHSQSWFAGYPELASLPGPYRPGPRTQWQNDHPDPSRPPTRSIADLIKNMVSPTFDPTKKEVYKFLDKFIGEMTTIFPSGYIHIGADENNGMAWKLNPEIVAWMKDHQMQTTDELQRHFVKRVHDILKKHDRRMIGWEEIYNDKLPKEAVVHKWIPEGNGLTKSYGTANDFASKGYNTLVSEGFYIDIFMPAYIYYNNKSLDSLNQTNVLGGEAAQWTELADNENLAGRIWPRAAAVAERLWSPANVTDVDEMYRRLFQLSIQLDEQGLQHLSNYERALRRLTNNAPTDNLKTLTDVLTPAKGYKKLFAKMTKPTNETQQTAPLADVSDIVFCDSETKWAFRRGVGEYLKKNDPVLENLLKNQLIIWRDNDAALQPYFQQSTRLAVIKQHSANLHDAAVIGIAALENIRSGNQPDASWQQEQLKKLAEYKKSFGETELEIVSEIEALVNRKLSPLPASFPVF